MFPTTIWTNIHRAGAGAREALESFAVDYRQPVLTFIRSRGFEENDAEDLCQEVFLRVMGGNVLAKAEASRGKFRSLLLSVTRHTILDRMRRRRRQEVPVEHVEVTDREPEFDEAWTLHLVERAFKSLRESDSRYYRVLRDHLQGDRQDRNKLWIARKKLIARIRAEVAGTCTSHREFEEEVSYLSSYLQKNLKNIETEGADPR